MTKADLDGIGLKGDYAPAGGVDVGDVLRLIYEAELANPSDTFGRLDLSLWQQQQRSELAAKMTAEHAELSEADKAALERGDDAAIRKLAERIYHQRQAERAKARGRTVQEQQAHDRLTQSHIDRSRLAAKARDDHLTARDDRAEPQPRQRDASGEERRPAPATHAESEDPRRALALRPPVTDAALLTAARQRLAQLTYAATQQPHTDLRSQRLGKDQPAYVLLSGFPWGGRSGALQQLPLIQFCPESLRAVLKALGIQTLMDYLAAVSSRAGRLLFAEMSGLPVTSLLLSAYRAELLDLPIARQRAPLPHLKDVLLLSRLGISGVRDLGMLAGLFDDAAEQLEFLASLVDILQRADRRAVGRTRITRHDLREWAHAAKRRGSELEAPAKVPASLFADLDAAGRLQLCAEAVLAWYLPSRHADADALWNTMVLRLLHWLRAVGVAPEGDALARFAAKLTAAGRQALAQLLAADRELDAATDPALTRFDDFALRIDETSLFYDLYPWTSPDDPRADGLICFFVEPVPDFRHVLGAAAKAEGRLPQALAQSYVCMNPVTGEVVTFGTPH
ncbi:MAG: hypothetical protein HY903_07655 [Deltaproteobacteria bacterium]|nr:hypothetical protein [Deltaproteobacteria bacterium]